MNTNQTTTTRRTFTAMAIDNPGTPCEEITQSWPSTPEFNTTAEIVTWFRAQRRACGQVFDEVGLVGIWGLSTPNTIHWVV